MIPAFNEAEHIAQVLHAVRRHAPEFDVLVVDDASRDTTAEIARASGARVPLLLNARFSVVGATSVPLPSAVIDTVPRVTVAVW